MILKRLAKFYCKPWESNQRILKSLKSSGVLSFEQHERIKAVGSRPSISCGLCKEYKNVVDKCPPFRLTLSAIGTPSYIL